VFADHSIPRLLAGSPLFIGEYNILGRYMLSHFIKKY